MTSSGSKTTSTAHLAKTLLFLALFFCAPVFADEVSDSAARQQVAKDMQNYRFKTVTTPEGLHFTIPEDMPIETRNGLKGPIPYDEYQYYKLRKLEEKMIEVDKKLERLENSVSSAMQTIQRQLETLAKQTPPQT